MEIIQIRKDLLKKHFCITKIYSQKINTQKNSYDTPLKLIPLHAKTPVDQSSFTTRTLFTHPLNTSLHSKRGCALVYAHHKPGRFSFSNRYTALTTRSERVTGPTGVSRQPGLDATGVKIDTK